MIKGIVFDLDGVVLDSMTMWRSCYRRFLLTKGYDIDTEEGNNTVQLTFTQAFYYLQDKYQLDMDVDTFLQGIDDTTSYAYTYEIPLKDGILELLNILKEKGIKCTIATNSDHEMIEPALKRLGIMDYFVSITSIADVGVGKNDGPDVYLKAVEDMGIQKEETLVFEDAIHCVKSAHAGGLKVVGVYDESARHTQEELKKEADYYVLNVFDALPIIEGK